MSTEKDILAGAIHQKLQEANGPMSKAQLAKALGIDTKTDPVTKEHNLLISAIDQLLIKGEIRSAYYPGDPPDAKDELSIIGDGSYGFYPAEREIEFLTSGQIIDDEGPAPLIQLRDFARSMGFTGDRIELRKLLKSVKEL